MFGIPQLKLLISLVRESNRRIMNIEGEFKNMATLSDLTTALSSLTAKIEAISPKLDKIASDVAAHVVDYQPGIDAVNAASAQVDTLSAKADSVDSTILGSAPPA